MDIKLLFRMPSAVITACRPKRLGDVVALILYMLVIIGIGVFYRQRQQEQ